MTDTTTMPPPKPKLTALPQGFPHCTAAPIAVAGRAWSGLSARHATTGGGDVRWLAGLAIRDLPDAWPGARTAVMRCAGTGWPAPDQPPDPAPKPHMAHAHGRTIAATCDARHGLARARWPHGATHSARNTGEVGGHAPGDPCRDRLTPLPRAVTDGTPVTAPASPPRTAVASLSRTAPATVGAAHDAPGRTGARLASGRAPRPAA